MEEINNACLECLQKIENRHRFSINRAWDDRFEFVSYTDVIEKYKGTKEAEWLLNEIEEACDRCHEKIKKKIKKRKEAEEDDVCEKV